MPKSNEGDPRDKTFQNGTDNQGPRSSGEDDAARTPYDHVVERFKNFIAQEQEVDTARGLSTSPENIIRKKLTSNCRSFGQSPEHDFWNPLLMAWDAIAFNRFGPDEKQHAGFDLSYAITPTIKLTPYQSSILDAMTDAVGITHQKGQTEIRIPYEATTYIKDAHRRSAEIFEEMFTPRARSGATVLSTSPRQKDNYRSQQKHS